MTWTLDWHVVARRDLLGLPMPTAERIDAAILAFAATGRGQVERLLRTDPRRLQLTVPGAVALLYLDAETRTLLVGRVFRRRS